MLKYVKPVYLIIDEILYFLMELTEVELRDTKFSQHCTHVNGDDCSKPSGISISSTTYGNCNIQMFVYKWKHEIDRVHRFQVSAKQADSYLQTSLAVLYQREGKFKCPVKE